MSGLDLTSAGIEEYWKCAKEDFIEILERMHEVDRGWVIEETSEAQELLSRLSDVMLTPEAMEFAKANPDTVIRALSMFYTGTSMRIIYELDEQAQNFFEFCMYVSAQNHHDRNLKLFLERVQTLDRARLLCRVFSSERIKLVKSIMAKIPGMEIPDEELDKAVVLPADTDKTALSGSETEREISGVLDPVEVNQVVTECQDIYAMNEEDD